MGPMLLGGVEDNHYGIDNNRSSFRKLIGDSVSDETSKVESNNELFRCQFSPCGHVGGYLGHVF